MTPNQKSVLKAIKELEDQGKAANVYAIRAATRVSAHYAEDILKALMGDGFIARGPFKRYSTRYELTEKGRENLRPRAV